MHRPQFSNSMENFSNVFLYSSFAPIALLLGGTIAILKAPSTKIRSAILHFAAGVIFSVVAVELLPDIMKRHDIFEIGIGFGAGVIVMLAIRYFLEPKNKKNGSSGFPTAFIVVVAVDLVIDGILIGIGLITNNETGLFLAILSLLNCFH